MKSLLAHPLTRGLSIDDPRTTALRRKIIHQKPFLKRLYLDWYRAIATAVPVWEPARGIDAALEIGSGAGFLGESGLLPGLITSDVFPAPGVDRVIDARTLPFESGSLRAIVMTDVLHHISTPRAFLMEAARCVRPGGVLSMIEPWVTRWSTLVYTRLHHEPFRPDAAEWEFPDTGPLSGANGALPWIMFVRDREKLERDFRMWKVEAVRPMMPLRYLVSGGVSMRSLMPGWSYPAWRAAEAVLSPVLGAMFAHVTVRRV